MENQVKFLNIVKLVGAIILIVGIGLFCFGFFGSGFSSFTPIGIGAVVGAGFIYIIGLFFSVTEEMLTRSSHN